MRFIRNSLCIMAIKAVRHCALHREGILNAEKEARSAERMVLSGVIS